MDQPLSAPNPFALLLNPEAVLAALASSERLNALQSQIFRPLDKPLIPRADKPAAEFDREVDASLESEETPGE
jgi:hypothetical protein